MSDVEVSIDFRYAITLLAERAGIPPVETAALLIETAWHVLRASGWSAEEMTRLTALTIDQVDQNYRAQTPGN